MSSVFTVSQINTYVRSLLDGDPNLKNIYISGEISNFTNHYRTGHLYFTLKDETAAIKAVMFRTAAGRLRFVPENGMQVIVRGSVSVFERDGAYQLYCEDMQPDGAGALSVAFEQRKQKLGAMGMFDESRKKSIPACPQRIGVVTSPTGAAVHDILTVLERRFPLATVVLAGVSVQGADAAPQIARAIERFNALDAADVLIVGRGGGSLEDLWAFNEELVAHAIFNSHIPVISAVGHETDVTIADFVADLRAPTPSAAAELAVPDTRELLFSLDAMLDSMTSCMLSHLNTQQLKLEALTHALLSQSPAQRLKLLEQELAGLKTNLRSLGGAALEKAQQQLVSLVRALELASPLKTLERGFAAAQDETGQPLRRAAFLAAGDQIRLRFADGTAGCTVTDVALD